MRYIDADTLKNEISKAPVWTALATKEMVDDHADDMVLCEGCRDCVEKGTGADCPSGYGYLYCRRKKSVVNEDDYCSWGSRR